MRTLPQHTPENEALQAECTLLHDELARLLVRRALLLEITGPDLEARWRVALGALQLEVLEAQCAVRRLRRALELVRAALNRGTVPCIVAIEAQLDAELAQWRLQLAAESMRLAAAEAWVAAPRLSAADSRELQHRFRALARRCHPDANPDGGAAARSLWLQANAAYAAGDLAALRALSLLAGEIPEAETNAGAARERRDALGAQVRRLLDELREIETRYPFTLRERLDDAAWVARERAALVARRDGLADQRVLLEVALADACAEAGHG